MRWETVLLLLIVVAGTSGELCVTRAMKTIGEVHDFRPSSLLRVLVRAVQVPWMWLGIGLMAVAFFSLLGALSLENVSFVVPVTALSYAAGTLGGQLFLGSASHAGAGLAFCLSASESLSFFSAGNSGSLRNVRANRATPPPHLYSGRCAKLSLRLTEPTR